MPLHRSLGKERDEEGDRQRKKRQRSRRAKHHNVDGDRGDEFNTKRVNLWRCSTWMVGGKLL